MPLASPGLQQIRISKQSETVYQLLSQDPANAYFLSEALQGIRQDLIGYGRPFLGGPTRKKVVALRRTQQLQLLQLQLLQLWLFWNPTVTPTTVTPIVIKLVLF